MGVLQQDSRIDVRPFHDTCGYGSLGKSVSVDVGDA